VCFVKCRLQLLLVGLVFVFFALHWGVLGGILLWF
jgi:hypothetical protein